MSLNKSDSNPDHGRSSHRNAMLEYFRLTDGMDIKWAHAVNSRAALDASLVDSTMMLEADVLMDPVNNVPIMAHPPNNSSDLTLREFLSRVVEVPRKGIKLDFKQTKVVHASIEILVSIVKGRALPPILLNADILHGPNDPPAVPLDQAIFFAACKPFPDAILSVGWTTRWTAVNTSGYSWDMVREMAALVAPLTQDVTFPVRASLVAQSRSQLLWLIEQDLRRYTLTVWTAATDVWDLESLKFLRKYKENVFFDLPDSQVVSLKQMDSEQTS